MKTNWIALKNGSLLLLIMAAVMGLATMGCEEGEDPILVKKSPAPEAVYSGDIMTKSFWVYPDGSAYDLFDGDISLEFPGGAVMTPTQFTLASFPVDHLDLDGHNVYNRGFHLEGNNPGEKFMTSNVKIRIKYDLTPGNWFPHVPDDPGSLTILKVSPYIAAYDRLVSIGECCTDFSCMTIKGCIGCCGFYVVGEE